MNYIKKRDGRTVDFDSDKITQAIHKAIHSVNENDGDLARKMSYQVIDNLENRFKNTIPSVEDVQDIVEDVLIKNGYSEVAKSYILYRRKRSEVRETKKYLGIKHDDLKLSVNAIRVLERRYLLKGENGNPVETPSEMFERVANSVSSIDKRYGYNPYDSKAEFYRMMSNLEFLPNSPTLMNAGTELGQLSACFVLPVEDSMKDIFEALTNMSLIHKSGGGTGFSFSKLRPNGDIVKSTKGVASGPVSFMSIFDQATEVIKQGGKRRGANMGILRIDHPDIIEFINSKEKEGYLDNFNISVGVTDEFMKAVQSDSKYDLINPRTGKTTEKLRARDIFDLITTMAWRTGDPGMIFLDEINRRHPVSHVRTIESTNPCGEVPLLPYESCNLGSINLSKMVKNDTINWEKLKNNTHSGIHFLDNVIDANKYPLNEIDRETKNNRKIGLGVMGLAEMFAKLNIPYNSEEAIETAENIMKFINEESVKKSVELGEKRGSFPNFKGSQWEKKYSSMRNATVNTIAPTGTISIIANTSSGIEPIFALSFVRNVMATQLLEVNPVFENVAKERNFYSKDLMMDISKTGSIQNLKQVPKDVRDLFVTSLDIDPEWHVRMQAAFQKYVDNSVSKTVNLPEKATLDDVKRIYMMAYKLNCKGITIYRYGSKENQVLELGGLKKEKGEGIIADSEFSGDYLTGCSICN
ncbi:ribonucleoside-diphosphate reductase, adenosylcobalamin-dependent [Methanohalobium evestigatum Z-7303]|uniref:Vitamin B12-dependent ribonucleotide reductase n=1 Tax=Methanohalobium evestigatum (strain ATCC BAA-1072 / DSM 3721 / NBRC 107634 / OCM 161 / Z-7303) TaxID=644295 RepID=D7E748_METEZ|nr:vitamin B12-dependent ribonucleotide reductase [Methanohalobium evestigatum]ADI73672.1 ribonucleoside-diphosphate reductase, adenosylcobalamin-dependent [Methanohalobium evestigatum Z-7303]